MKTPFIDIHTHSTNPEDGIIQIVNLDLEQPCPEQGYYSYGIHPWALDRADFQVDEALNKLKENLQQPQVIALGEAGLDKFHADFEQQIRLFERQIVLSENMKKPMILHDVKSHNEIIALRKKHRVKQPWIVHGFNGTAQDAAQLTRQGIFLSVGESLLHPDRKIYNSLKTIDIDYVFFETDMAEIGIMKVYEAAAKLLEIDVSELKTKIFSNFARIFRGFADKGS
ncbi:MAG: TatD family hydrolase [Bacteroidales bacterium]|nr:TatD family hydrolase [Bacteroidales bacterium]